MQPYTTASGFTTDSLALAPSSGQGYNAGIQQTDVRKRINEALAAANVAMQTITLGGSL